MSKEYNETILSVKNLKISFKTDEGILHAVRGVSYDLHKGETLCIVGESGSGKSVSSKAVMGILPANAIIESGQILYEGQDLTKVGEEEFHRIRGKKIGMIFQDPLSSLNPIMKVGKQITEAMLINKNRLKTRYDSLIAKEQAEYNNAVVVMKEKIKLAKHKLETIESEAQEKINVIETDLTSKEHKILAMDKHDPELYKKAEQYEVDRKQAKEEIKKIRKDCKENLKATKVAAKTAIKEAKAEFKDVKPGLKKNLKDAKKRALQDNKTYEREEKQKDKETLLNFDKETLKTIEDKSKELSLLREKLSKAPSLANAKKEIADKEKELDNYKKERQLERSRLADSLHSKYKITRKEAKAKALEVMREVGIPQPEIRYKQYPFEFSGGMRQRIVIAIALTADPEVLICDEPTTALDVTIQAQILELINRLKDERNMSIIFITHDLGVVANMADRVAVMYAGKIIEVGTAEEIFYDPRHPYTWALLSSIPDIDSKEKLEAIPGTPPYLLNPPKGDAFAPRNKYALAIDYKEEPPYFQISETHYAATWLLDKRAPETKPPKIVTQRIKISLERAGIHNEEE